MPQKMLTPSWCPIMLWIISVSKTVLPTPAPPNRPALPPRSSGTSTSMTLMPVSKISDLVERSRQRRRRPMHGTPLRHRTAPLRGRWRCQTRRTCAREFPWPTGAFNGPPVSSTAHAAGQTLRGRQRDAAHVARIALRQHFDGRYARPRPRAAANEIGGKCSSNRISTTLPRTETTAPRFARTPASPSIRPATPRLTTSAPQPASA